MTSPTPPPLATRILAALLPAEQHDAFLGDLHEEYGLRATDSPFAASRWYWSQALRSSAVIIWSLARRGQWISTVVIAIAAYVFVGVLNGAGLWLVEQWMGEAFLLRYAATAAIGLTAIAAGAHLASRVRRSAGYIIGCLVATVAVTMLVARVDTSPGWYQVTFLVLGPLAAHIGTLTTPDRDATRNNSL